MAINIFGENTSAILDPQMAKLQAEYQRQLQELHAQKMGHPIQQQPQQQALWVKVDNELSNMPDEYKKKLMESPEYIELSDRLGYLVQSKLMHMVMPQIENMPEGKEILDKQYSLINLRKSSIKKEVDAEMEEFRKWKQASNNNTNNNTK